MGQTTLDDYHDAYRQARRVERVCFTGRHPFTTTAYSLGYTVGFREDGSFQAAQYPNVDLPVGFLDNNFHDPNLDRYLEVLGRYQPDVAVLGDVYTPDEALVLQEMVDNLQPEYPDTEFVVVPKCPASLDCFDDEIVLGYSAGYADTTAADFSAPRDWRGRRVHILGGSPPKQYAVIDQLTQPTLDDAPPADIVGLDGNSCFKAAYFGEYWTPTGYERADHLSIRETVARSLTEIKAFWQAQGIWPTEEPIERYGSAVVEPNDPIWLDAGGDPLVSCEDVEQSYIGEYDAGTYAFQSEKAKQFIEYREGWRE